MNHSFEVGGLRPVFDRSVIRYKSIMLRHRLRMIHSVQNHTKQPSQPTPHHSLKHPLISRLPAELLVEIFLHCVPDFIGLDATLPPWTLSYVCSCWRSVVLSTSKLWSAFELYFLEPGLPVPIPLIETILERSRNHPLSIRLDCETPLATHPALEALMRHSLRWVEIDFYLNIALMQTLNAIKGRVPMLQKLEILPDINEPDGMPLIDAFEIVPQLQDATIRTHPGDIVLKLPWSQLTHYTGKYDNVEDVLTILQEAKLLEHCVLEQLSDELVDASTPLTHNRLRSLMISTSDFPNAPNHAGNLLASLVLPNLQELSLRHSDEGNDKVISYTLDFLSRSSCTLKAFALEAACVLDSSINSLLQAMPRLITLRLGGNIDDNLLGALTVIPDETPLVPLLLHMAFGRVRSWQPVTFNAEVLINMVQSRFKDELAGDSHEVVHPQSLQIPPLVHDFWGIIERLGEQRELGLQVSQYFTNSRN